MTRHMRGVPYAVLVGDVGAGKKRYRVFVLGIGDFPFDINVTNAAFDNYPYMEAGGWLNASVPPAPPQSGPWQVNDSYTYEDQEINLTGNLIVNNGGNLTLDNVNLTSHNIIVQNGGYLKLKGSIVNCHKIVVANGGVLDTDPSKLYIYGNSWIDGEARIYDNTEVYINCSYDGEYNIVVNATGILNITGGSIIQANNSE